MQAVNQAFLRLRRSVPIENRNKRVSKVKTLQRAIDYIRKLERILADDDEQQNQVSSSSQALVGLSQQPKCNDHSAKQQQHLQACDPMTSKQAAGARRARKSAGQVPARAQPVQRPDSQAQPAPNKPQQLYTAYPNPASYYHCPGLVAGPAAPTAFCPAAQPANLGAFQSAPSYTAASGHAESHLYSMSPSLAQPHQQVQHLAPLRAGEPIRCSQPVLNYQLGQRWTGPSLAPPTMALQSPSSSSSGASLGVCGSPSSSSTSSSSGSSACARQQAQQQVTGYLAYATHAHLSTAGQHLSANTDNNDNLSAYSNPEAQRQQLLLGQQQTESECKTANGRNHDQPPVQQQLSGLHPPPQVRPPLLLSANHEQQQQQINNTPSLPPASSAMANEDANLHDQQLQHHHQYQQQSFSINQQATRSHLSGQLAQNPQASQQLIEERQPLAGYH